MTRIIHVMKGLITPGMGVWRKSHLCLSSDVNECFLSSPCRADERCVNTEGSYRCTNPSRLRCYDGYELNVAGTSCVGESPLIWRALPVCIGESPVCSLVPWFDFHFHVFQTLTSVKLDNTTVRAEINALTCRVPSDVTVLLVTDSIQPPTRVKVNWTYAYFS